MNNFTLKIIAGLDKALSKRMIKSDLKSFDGQFTVKVIANLNKILSQRALKQTLKELTNLNVNVNAKLNKSSSEAQLRQQLKTLQAKIEDLDIRLKANTEQLNATVRQAASNAQRVADQVPIEYKVSIKKDKLISDLSLLAKQNSKLFSNSAATQKYGKLLDDAYGATTGGDVQELTLRMAAFKSELKATNLSGLTLADTFKKTVGRAGELISATSMVMVAYSQARKAYTEVKALDDSMTGLYKVADEIRSRDDFPAYLDKSIAKAKQLSVETKSLISSVTDWKKIGFGLGLSEKLSEVSTKLEKTGDMSIDKATSTLISTLQAFKEIDGLTEDQYSERALAIADKINHISNTRSIDAEGISDALQNSVATLQEANNDLNQSIAMISAGNKIFQSPSEVGNMLKIVSMRLRGVSEDGEEAEESVAKLRDTILNLTNDKVDIMLDENTFKSTYDILLEISKVYESLSDKSQSLLLEKIAGKQRGASTAALLQNMSEAEAIYQDALNSTGSVNKEFERYQESASAAVIRFKETLVDTYTGILSGDMIKGTADTGSAILDLANKFNLLQSSIIGITAVGTVKGITAIGSACISSAKQMSTLGDAINRVNSLPTSKKERISELKSIGENTKSLTDKQLKLLLSNDALEESDRIRILRAQNLSPELAKEKLATLGLTQATDAQAAANVKATTSTFSLKAAIIGLGANMKAAFMSNPVGISLMALSVTIGAFVGQYQKYRQELEETRQKNIEAAESVSAQSKKLNELYTQYTKLSSLTDRTSSQEQELQKSVEDITVALGDKAKVLEGLTIGTDEYAQALRNATKAEIESQYAAAVRGRKAAEENLSEDVWSNWDGSQVDVPLNVNMTGIENHVKALGTVRDMLSEFEKETSRGINWAPENYEDMDSVVEYYHALIEARERLTLQSKELNDDSILDSDIYNNMDNAISQMSESVDTYTKRRYEELKMEYEFHNGIPATVDGFNSMKNAILSASGAGEGLKKVFNDLLTEDFSSLSVQAQQIAGSGSKDIVLFDLQNKDTAKIIDEFQKKMSTLSASIEKIRESKLTSSDLLDLQQEFPELIHHTDDLSSALTNLVDQSLSNMVDYLQAAGASEEFIQTLKNLASEVKGMNHVSDSAIDLSKNIQESYDLLGKVRKEVAKTKLVSLDSLTSIAKQFPSLSAATAEYTQGLISTADLMTLLEQAYNDDADAFRTAMAYKLSDNEDFFTTIRSNNEGLFTSLAEAYGDDIKNWNSLAKAKASIDETLIQQLSKAWGEYYGVVIDQATGMASLVNKTPTTGLTAEESVALIVARTNAESLINSANEAKKALDRAAQIEISLPDFGGIGSSGAGGSKDKSPKENSDIDWIDQRTKLLKNKQTELENQLSDTYTAYTGLSKAEIERVNDLMNTSSIPSEDAWNQLIALASKADMTVTELTEKVKNGTGLENKQSILERLMQLDNEIIKNAEGSIDDYKRSYEDLVALVPEYRDKIENGGVDIELVSGNLKTQLTNAMDAYNKLYDAQQSVNEAKEKRREHKEGYLSAELDSLDAENSKLEKMNSLVDEQINYIKASGSVVDTDAYQQQIDNFERLVQNYNRLIKLAKNKRDKLDPIEDSAKYAELTEQVDDYESARLQALETIAKKKFEVAQIPIDNLTKIIGMYNDITSTIENWGAELESSGKKLDAGYYQSLIENGTTIIDQYKEQADLIQDLMSEYDTGSDNWNELYSQLQSVNGEMSSMVQNLHKWNEELLKMPMENISSFSSELQKVVSGLNGVKGDLDTVISSVTGAIKAQMDALGTENSLTNDSYNERIKLLQKQLDLLEKTNTERNLQYNLEKAQFELERARNQKTTKVVREGEVTWEKDSEAERDAQKAVQDAEYDITKNNLQTEMDGLNDTLDDINEKYNDQVDALQKQSDKWSEIAEKIKQAQDELKANELLGKGWKDKVTSGNDTDIYNMFKNLYQTNADQIQKYEEQIESTDNIYSLLQDYITSYKEGAITYEQAQSGIKDLLSQMNGKMSATDNLQNIYDYLGTVNGTAANADAVLKGIQSALEKSSDELIKSLEQYNENAGLISEYTTSWQQLTNNVADMKDILEDVKDALEDAADRDDDDRGSSSGSGSGGHWDSSDSSHGPGVAKYKKGVENGPVGKTKSKAFDTVQTLGTKTMENGEVLAIVHEGEAILNINQQEKLIENLKVMGLERWTKTPSWLVPDYSNMNYGDDYSTPSKNTNVEINIGDITIEECNDAKQFLEGIQKGKLRSAIIQELGKR
ncbi:phage tail tape measure protein [Enterocloster citroniae]|uniref:Phage tail tape measure protein domain-containing protein n=1 Tax=[Clostridium] citroniae WAL-17108 TaxID=742733 RepID=G5HQG1_9FIRM|nr:phage tail tape measure protein [Enterocloster citroniae]EHE96287.1 hypothetical protein HMPREF9469_04823 [ [[Clostridium] citroniae WAL-17108]MCC3387080.1 phage tail tape measure protein [Enterocloster citroniae]